MENTQINPDEHIIFDLDELSLQTEYPIRAVCASIRTVIEPMIEDRQQLADINLGVHEMVKDVETHGDESDIRLVIVRRELGGVAIETIDKPKKHSEHNGFGRIILETIFGDDYSTTTDGDVFKGHLYIRHDGSGPISQ